MTKKVKLLERFLSAPKDFTYDELKTVLNNLGYDEDHKGKTSGSRVAFVCKLKNEYILIHKPHPNKIVNRIYIKNIIKELHIKQILL
jgi:hypothetical protein